MFIICEINFHTATAIQGNHDVNCQTPGHGWERERERGHMWSLWDETLHILPFWPLFIYHFTHSYCTILCWNKVCEGWSARREWCHGYSVPGICFLSWLVAFEMFTNLHLRRKVCQSVSSQPLRNCYCSYGHACLYIIFLIYLFEWVTIWFRNLFGEMLWTSL